MPSDRFLIRILFGIGVLVVLALVLFFIREGSVGYVDDTTPSGVVHNYMLALQQRDYNRAYEYVAEGAGKPDLLQFQQYFLTYQGEYISSIAVEVGETAEDQLARQAVVQLVLLRSNSDLFGGTSRESQTVGLIQQDGVWKISSAPYPFWSFDWPDLPVPKTLPSPSGVQP